MRVCVCYHHTCMQHCHTHTPQHSRTHTPPLFLISAIYTTTPSLDNCDKLQLSGFYSLLRFLHFLFTLCPLPHISSSSCYFFCCSSMCTHFCDMCTKNETKKKTQERKFWLPSFLKSCSLVLCVSDGGGKCFTHRLPPFLEGETVAWLIFSLMLLHKRK